MRELHGEEGIYRSDPKDSAVQMKALVNLLNEINELTKNGGIKELLQLKRENLSLRHENEYLRSENLRLLNMNTKKDKESYLADHQANFQKLGGPSHQEKEQRELSREEAKQPKAWMRKTDSDWKTNASLNNEYAPERLPKNNSDNKLALGLNGSRPDAFAKPRDPPAPPGRLYDRVKETMNHKANYSNSVEKQAAREIRNHPQPQPQPQPVPPGAPQRNSSKKPSNAYLLNESMERNQRRVATESSYNNYLNPAPPEKRGPAYIRKPKNETAGPSNSGNGSKLRSTLLQRINLEDPDLGADESRRFSNNRYSTSGSSNQRDYSLEQYQKQQAKERGREFEFLKENIRDLKERDRSGSRSIGRSVKPIDLSNDRINIGKVLYQRGDHYD